LRTDLLNAEGIFLALVSVSAEAARQWLVRQEAGETGASKDEAVEAVRDSSVVRRRLSFGTSLRGAASLTYLAQRAAVLHVAAYVALFPLHLHRYRAYSQGPSIACSILWPFLALFASLAFIFAQQAGTSAFSTGTSVYSASNAAVVALVAVADWHTSDSSAYLLAFFIVFAANVAYQLVPSTVGGVSLNLDSGDGADYNPLGPSSSSKITSSLPARPPLRALALFPNILSLLGAAFISLAPRPSLDLVIAHHSRSPSAVAHHLAAMRLVPHVRKSRVRIYVYEKGDWTDEELWRGLSGIVDPRRDEVVRLPNVGREGGTYLEHIVRHYNASISSSMPARAGGGGGAPWSTRGALGGGEGHVRPFADTTLFLQEHLAWPGVAGPRLRRTLSARTGFLSLGPYLSNLCGRDSEVGTEMGGINEVFELVKGRPCVEGNEDDRVLSTWFGQFAASRKTLLKNELGVYERLVRLVEVRSLSSLSFLLSPSLGRLPLLSLTLAPCRRPTTTRSTSSTTRAGRRRRRASLSLSPLGSSSSICADWLSLSTPPPQPPRLSLFTSRSQQPRLRPCSRAELAPPPPL